MVRVRKVAGGRTNIRDIGHYEVGDEDDVSPADAEYLVEERGDFEFVEEDADAEEPEASDEADDEDGPTHPEEAEEVLDDADTEDESADDSEDEDDYEDRTAAAEALADEHWQHTVSAVEDGEADDYLDILEQVDDRNSVQSAIEERRNELGR